MNIEHIEYFITVVKAGSFNKAARILYISQPSLGKIIRDLENELGITLLHRTRHGVRLTTEGDEFLGHASKMMQEYREIRALYSDPAVREDTFSVSMTKFSHIMECFIETVAWHKDDPAFAYRLNEETPENVIEDVYSNQSNVGVLYFDSRRKERFLASLADKRLSYHTLGQAKPHILISENHPLQQQNIPVNLQTVGAYPFVRFMGQHEDFTNRIQSEQGELNLNRNRRIVYVCSRSSLLRMIERSDFYGIGISSFSRQEDSYRVKSIPIEDCTSRLEFGYIYSQSEKLSPIAREFIGELKKRFAAVH